MDYTSLSVFRVQIKSSISLTSYDVNYNKTREKARLKIKKEIPMNF